MGREHDIGEDANDHLNRRDLRRFQHAMKDIERELNRPGGGKDYYARLLVEEANQQLDVQETIRGANHGEVYNYRFSQDRTGIHIDEIEVEERWRSTKPFERGRRPLLPPPKQ